MIGSAIWLHFDEPGHVRFSVSDDGGENWRKPTSEEKRGPLNDAVDAFILTLVDAGVLQRVHTAEGERPYYDAERPA